MQGSGGRENECATEVFASSFISQTAVCYPLALMLQACRTPNGGVFPALSALPFRQHVLPSSSPAVYQALLNTAGDLSPPRPGTCGVLGVQPAGNPPGTRPAPGRAMPPSLRKAPGSLPQHVSSARLVKSNCGLVRVTVWEVYEAPECTNVQLVLASGSSLQPGRTLLPSARSAPLSR